MLVFVVKVWILINFVFRNNLYCVWGCFVNKFLRWWIFYVLKRFLEIYYFNFWSLLSHKFETAWVSFSVQVVHTCIHYLWSLSNKVCISKLSCDWSAGKEISCLMSLSDLFWLSFLRKLDIVDSQYIYTIIQSIKSWELMRVLEVICTNLKMRFFNSFTWFYVRKLNFLLMHNSFWLKL